MSERPSAAAALPNQAAQVPAGGDAGLWVGLVGAAAVLALAALVVAPPLSRLLFPPVDVHFFSIWTGLVHPKPVQETRYLLAVGLTIAAAIALARLPRPTRFTEGRAVRLVATAAKLALGALAVWCFRRYEMANDKVGVGHFHVLDVVAGAVVALVVAALVWWRPALAAPDAARPGPRPRPGLRSRPLTRTRRGPATRWIWPALAGLVTVCWLLPAVFRNENIGHALFVMWWHLEFVYGDFVATLNGRTPLIDYNAEYGSLLPLALEPALRVLGASVGAFTGLMCLLTLGALVAVERALALISRSERLAFGLYLPFLAAGLFTEYRGGGGGERFYFANYFAVFPLRYLGPYLLLWLCVRHLRALRPRHATWLFLLGGLATLNDVEFGLPALAATVLALVAAAERGEPVKRVLAPLARALALGLGAALAAVTVVLWLRTGQLIELDRLTRYAQLFGRAGFGEVPTPTIGLHLVLYATFVASLAGAALRHRRAASDRALTGALAFAGVFGLGAGSYYMGGSNPSQLIGVFSAWGLAVALLALQAVRALAARRGDPTARPPAFALVAALLVFGLLATAVSQFPAPWTQLRRIDARAAAQPYDRTAAVAFVRRTARPGERVVVLEELGPLIAHQAGVANVSPYSEVWAVWSREQLEEIIAALRRAHGTRFYLGRAGTVPGIPIALAAAGFTRAAQDGPSQLTEWRLTSR